MKFFIAAFNLSLLSLVFQAAAQSNPGCEDPYKYECGTKFLKYSLDNEPADFGVTAGEYAPGKTAYVGLISFMDYAYAIGPLQLDPPGVLFVENIIFNDTSRMWYLFNNPRHVYEWVDSQNGDIPPFSVTTGKDRIGIDILPGRIVDPNGAVYVGVVLPNENTMNYMNNSKINAVSSGYQVLTCKSSVANETKYPTPQFPVTIPNVDTGCINNWVPYNGEKVIDGVSAGEYDCNNTAYVGKAKIEPIWYPVRIQTVENAGYYSSTKNITFYAANGSYYLADNPNYTYKWMSFNFKNIPSNAVYVRNDFGPIRIAVARATINGRTEIGKVSGEKAIFPSINGNEEFLFDFEILVCDPTPRYQCGQIWKNFSINGPKVEGFPFFTLPDNSSFYVGRSCDYTVAQIQVDPLEDAGAYFLDEYTGRESYENETAEYLVRNTSYTYKWTPSKHGLQVENALEIYREGKPPAYIGITRINDDVFIGSVRPGEGLIFVDSFGNQRSSSSYQVLTCTSPHPENGIYEEESDEIWYGDHWCPPRKAWNHEKKKCECREEFRGVLNIEGGRWDEKTCSIIVE